MTCRFLFDLDSPSIFCSSIQLFTLPLFGLTLSPLFYSHAYFVFPSALPPPPSSPPSEIRCLPSSICTLHFIHPPYPSPATRILTRREVSRVHTVSLHPAPVYQEEVFLSCASNLFAVPSLPPSPSPLGSSPGSTPCLLSFPPIHTPDHHHTPYSSPPPSSQPILHPLPPPAPPPGDFVIAIPIFFSSNTPVTKALSSCPLNSDPPHFRSYLSSLSLSPSTVDFRPQFSFRSLFSSFPPGRLKPSHDATTFKPPCPSGYLFKGRPFS